MKTILVPVDFSAATAKVCAAAATLAKLVRARLSFVHVMRPLPLYPEDFYATEQKLVAEITAAGRASAHKKLQALMRRWGTAQAPAQGKVREGSPVREIMASADATKPAYIVIGSHGHGAMYDLFVGSTTHGVMKRAKCPVLVVPHRGRS